jgi:hypothetical protein
MEKSGQEKQDFPVFVKNRAKQMKKARRGHEHSPGEDFPVP